MTWDGNPGQPQPQPYDGQSGWGGGSGEQPPTQSWGGGQPNSGQGPVPNNPYATPVPQQPGPYGGGGGAFPPPPPPPPPGGGQRRAGMIIGAVAAVVVIAAAGTVAAVELSGGDGHSHHRNRLAAGSASVSAAASHTPRAAAPSPSPTGVATGLPTGVATALPSTAPKYKAAIKGWQPVYSKRGYLYDVPKSGWKVNTPSTIIGFEDSKGNPEFAMSGSAVYKQDYCTKADYSNRAGIGIGGQKDGKVSQEKSLSRSIAYHLGQVAYTSNDDTYKPTVKLSKTTKWKSAHGVTGWATTAHITVNKHNHDACTPKTATVRVIAVKARTGGGLGLFSIWEDLGYKGAPSSKTVNKILRSLRPVSS